MSQGLTVDEMSSIVIATLPSVKKKFADTQKLNRYVAERHFLNRAEEKDPAGGTHGWNLRLRSAQGTTRALRAYQAVGFVKGYYTERCSVSYVNMTNTAMVFDRIEMAYNRNNPGKLFDLVDEAYSAAQEDIANLNEAMIFSARENATDDEHWSGLKELFPPSADSSGNFVPDEEGGHNGVYIVYNDGSVGSTYANLDAAPLTNERHRGYCMTHGGVMDERLVAQIKKAQDDLAFDPLAQLKGEQELGDLAIYMDPKFKQQYDNLVALGPDARNGDYYPTRQTKVNGTDITSVTQLNQDDTRSIYLINHRVVKFLKPSGMWMVEGKGIVPGAHNVEYMPVDYAGQLVCFNRQIAGGRIHGSF